MSDEIPTTADAPLPFVAIRALFDSLGVATFGAALPEGRIQWMDAQGTVVATARCRVVLSWAAGNESYLWATRLPGFSEAGVPVVPLPDGEEESRVGVTKEEAESVATAACMGTGVQFLYEAPTGGGCLFLAVEQFAPGAPDEDRGGAAARFEKARTWAARTLARLAETIESEAGSRASLEAMGAFAKDLRNQSDLALTGLPGAASVRQLADRVEDLQAVAGADPTGAAAALRAEVAGIGAWGGTIGEA
ncbi:MAG: hypothetical protein VX000_12400 [Myxococcota bacterium]|nr:hypothetical protein [Myxococcota bacterium]